MIAMSTTPDAASHALAFASMAKAVGGDTAMYVSSLALELMDLDGGEERLWVEKAFRDAKLTQIYEGTNQLNRLTLFMADIEKSLKVELKNPFALKTGKGVG
jgi:alkylation response protein AidB-like acyl-CoA dehydrogenase